MASPDHSATPVDYGGSCSQDTMPPRPVVPRVQVSGAPTELRQTPQWVPWRLELRENHYTKEPYQARRPQAHASTTNPKTFASFAEALTASERPDAHLDGVGFVFTATDCYGGMDLDNCRDPATGALDPLAQAIVESVPTYWEISISGTGLHAIGRAVLPGPGLNRPIIWSDGRAGRLELYDRGRFFVVSGAHLDGTPETIGDVTDAFAAVYARYNRQEPTPPAPCPPAPSITLEDQELLQRAFAAANGPAVRALYEAGDLSAYGGDESRADLALADYLGFWTKDRGQLRRLMEGSALRRDKWYTRRGTGDWLDLTIDKALADVRETYSGGRPRPSAPPPPAVEALPEGSDAIMAELARLRAERDAALRRADEAEAQNRALLQLMSHPHLRNEVRLIVAEAAEYQSALRRGAVDAQGLAWLYIGPKEGEGLAGKAGRAPRTISRQLQRHAEYLIDEQPLVELHEDEVEGSDGTHRTRYRFKVPFLEQGGTVPQLLEKLATYTPVTAEGAPRATPGGNRGHCPSCGGALERASTIKRRTQEIESYQEICTACGVIHAEGEQVLSDETHILRYRRMRLDLPGDPGEEAETSSAIMAELGGNSSPAMMAEVGASTDPAPDTSTTAVEDHYRATSCPVLDVEPSAAIMAEVPAAVAPHGLRLPPGCTHWCPGAHRFPVPLPAKAERCSRCTRTWRAPGAAP